MGKHIQLEFLHDAEQLAIDVIRTWEPREGYQLCFSGGKDSVVIKHLADLAGVRYDLVYNRTGIDPPELVHFIRDNFPGIIVSRPKMTVWEGVMRHGLPRRQVRWCCELLKESSGAGRVLLTGIRAAESRARKARCIVETGRTKAKTYVNPIFFWSTEDVWSHIHKYSLPYCSLYDQGYKRLGCVLCPMTMWRRSLDDWERYPKLAEAWFRAGRRYWERRKDDLSERWPTAEDFIWWWLTRGQATPEQVKEEAGRRGLVGVLGLKPILYANVEVVLV